MLSVEAAPGKFLRIGAEGILRAEDYTAFERRFGEVLRTLQSPAPLLLDLTRFKGWTAAGLMRDVRFDLRHRNSFCRIAVLGVRPWHRWITYAATPVFAAPLRYFDVADEADARAWLASRDP